MAPKVQPPAADAKRQPPNTKTRHRIVDNSKPKGEETLTVLAASKYLRNLGFDDQTPHNIQRYCRGERRRGQLTCYWHEDDQQHLISKASLRRFAERLSNEAKRPLPSETDHVNQPIDESNNKPETSKTSNTQKTTDKRSNFDGVFDHPFVLRLEGQIKELKDDYKQQVLRTEDIQRQHSQEIANLHQQLMIATSQSYADAYLELAGNKRAPSSPSEQRSVATQDTAKDADFVVRSEDHTD